MFMCMGYSILYSSPHFSGECNFETNLCTWYNARVGDDFDWIVGSGSTPSFYTGPTADRNGNRQGIIDNDLLFYLKKFTFR